VALPNLADAADLTARGVTPTSIHTVMLAVASSLVRSAADSPILETDSTVTLWALDQSQWLSLPGKPVTAVTSVELDGDTLTAGTDYKLVHGDLWSPMYWGDGCEPLEVVVEMTHGLVEVPAAIVQLVCDLAILGAAAAADGAHDPRIVAEQIDDYKVQFADGAEAVSSAMYIPELTAQWLRAEFGGGATVVSFR
jgi:hypothetical protein